MKLDQFLKWMGWVATGGEAKQQIQSGAVTVNGVPPKEISGLLVEPATKAPPAE